MPFPLIAFIVGAAAGATATYLLTNKGQDRDLKPVKVVIPETTDADADADADAEYEATPTARATTSDAPDPAKGA